MKLHSDNLLKFWLIRSFINSFIKHNIILRQKKLLTINFLKKIGVISSVTLSKLWVNLWKKISEICQKKLIN